MSRDSMSFKEYIQNYSTDNIKIFKEIFNNRLHKMSDTLSSKQLIRELDIVLNGEFIIFRTTYMDFFKLRLNRNVM